jgi:hypothetical protein
MPWRAYESLDRLADLFNANRDEQQRIAIHSLRTSGTSAFLRFEPSRATLFVQVHVQSTDTGEGGATYDPDNYTSSDEIDCRSTRIQDRTITLDLSYRYYVWLIPVFKDNNGNTVLYDGEGVNPDYMTFTQLNDGPTGSIPFYKSDGTLDEIALTSDSSIPFFLSDGTQDNIALVVS